MKEKLGLLLIAKLQIWTLACEPFLGMRPPTDHKSLSACSIAQTELDRVVHDFYLIHSTDSVKVVSNQPKQEK